TVGLGAHLARLARGDRRRIGDQGEHAERRLSERLGARRTPGPDPDVGLDLELLVARIEFTHGGFGGPCRGPPSLLRACNSASRVCGVFGGPCRGPPSLLRTCNSASRVCGVFGGPCRGPPSLLRACNSASRVCGGLGGHVGAPHL